jgi:hypothetical protein
MTSKQDLRQGQPVCFGLRIHASSHSGSTTLVGASMARDATRSMPRYRVPLHFLFVISFVSSLVCHQGHNGPESLMNSGMDERFFIHSRLG